MVQRNGTESFAFLEAFVEFLAREEKSAATQAQYRREAERFLMFVCESVSDAEERENAKEMSVLKEEKIPTAVGVTERATEITVGISTEMGEEILAASKLQKEEKRPTAYKLRKEEKIPTTVGVTEKAAEITVGCSAEMGFPGNCLTRELVLAYKERLMGQFLPVSVNAKPAAVNRFLAFVGREELRVRLLKIQRKAFCAEKRLLKKAEYLRLVAVARQKKDRRLELLLETLCATGIRISELSSVTAEAVARGEAVIHLKGKTRVILLPEKLRKLLRSYARSRGIRSGAIFVTRSGRALDRSNVWKMMKALCAQAGVGREKVFPHNLRHLFARCFYEKAGDIAKLADILGHSSINTTRNYLMSTGIEHRKWMNRLGLVTT